MLTRPVGALNLLSNALKFTRTGGIRLALAPAGGRLELTVADTGTGMDGYELRARGLADCLMIALSGYSQEQDRARTHAAGFALHLVKPVDPARLRHALESGR